MGLFSKLRRNKKPKDPNRKRIHYGLWILIVIYTISIVFSLVLAGILIFNAPLLAALPGFSTNIPTATIYSIAIFLIFFSAFSFYIARGLKRGHNNARIALLAVLIINIIGGVISVVGSQNPLSWINISLNFIAILYILLHKKARAHFS